MTREDIIHRLNEFEAQHHVEHWQVNDIDIWPIVKMLVFFEANKQINLKSTSKNIERLISKGSKYILNIIKSRINKRPTAVLQKDEEKTFILFSAPKTVRTELNSTNYSRYFDPILDELDTLGYQGCLFEYLDCPIDNIYKPERVYKIAHLYRYYFKQKKMLIHEDELTKYTHELNELATLLSLNPASMRFKISNYIKETLVWKALWSVIIEQTQPKIAFGICYYNAPMFGLRLAAGEKNIPFVDMQHGGQGALHPCYTYHPKIAKLNLIPGYFWLWDSMSKNHIDQWIENNKRTILGGNPWIDFINTAKTLPSLDSSKKNIVYTLQTNLNPLIPESIIKAIDTTPTDFKWYFRYHPRMTKLEIVTVEKLLNPYFNTGVVDIKTANNMPLPHLLQNATVHVSAFSGSISEAALLEVPMNITNHTSGLATFGELIKEGKCIYYNDLNETDWWYFINMELSNKQGTLKEEKFVAKPDYKTLIHELENN